MFEMIYGGGLPTQSLCFVILLSTVFCSSFAGCLVVLTHFCFCKLSAAILCCLRKSTEPSFAPSAPPPIKKGVWKSGSRQSPQNKFVVAANFFRSPTILESAWPVGRVLGRDSVWLQSCGGIALQHYRAHPRTLSAFIRILSSRFTLRSGGNGFIWSRRF